MKNKMTSVHQFPWQPGHLYTKLNCQQIADKLHSMKANACQIYKRELQFNELPLKIQQVPRMITDEHDYYLIAFDSFGR